MSNLILYPSALFVGFAPANYTVIEGDPVDFIVVLSSPSSEDLSVSFSTFDDTAKGKIIVLLLSAIQQLFTIKILSPLATTDYTVVTQTVTIVAGELSAVVSVNTVDDFTAELPEVFGARLTNPTSGLTLSQDTAIANILDNDSKIILCQFGPKHTCNYCNID